MRRFLKWMLLYPLLMIVTSKMGYAEQGKISGFMFGDYYYVAANHNQDLEDKNGLWLRRIYVTYDQGLNEDFAVRFRMEMSSAGDFISKTKLEPVVKDAYLKWKHGRYSIVLGLSPTPTYGLIEKIWGYRSVEKTPLDLQKFGSSRDFGLALKGSLDQQKRFNYHLMLANGNGIGSETDTGKKVLFSLSANLTKSLILEGYADFEERPGKGNRYTLQGFGAYQTDHFRVGLQFAHQNREMVEGHDPDELDNINHEMGEGVKDLQLQIASVFAAGKISKQMWAFARFDRTFDPNPDGAKISYIPFDETAASNFIVAGLDFRPIDNVRIMPNVEAIFYDKVSGVRPDTDIIPRLTFYYAWK